MQAPGSDNATNSLRFILAQIQRLRRRKDIAPHFRRRIRWQSDVHRTIANHIKQEPPAKLFGARASKLPGKKPASVQAISLRKILVGLFAVKEHQFNPGCEIWVLSKHSG